MIDRRTTVNAARSLHGRLRLRFATHGARTFVTGVERSPPYHLQRLLYLDACRPDLAQAVVLNSTAGLFAGDRLELDIEVQSLAAVEIATPASTRIFGMDDGYAETRTSISVESGGYLEYVPRSIILCRDAELRVSTSVYVRRGGMAAIGEVVAFGRAAAGERHCYRRLDLRAELHYDGHLTLAEALYVAPEDDPDAAGALGDAAAHGALHLLGVDSDIEQLIAHVRGIIDEQCHVVGGVSTLPFGGGVAVRLLGNRPHAVYEALRSVALEFRRSLNVHRAAEPYVSYPNFLPS
jgi:urease accessory protein